MNLKCYAPISVKPELVGEGGGGGGRANHGNLIVRYVSRLGILIIRDQGLEDI